MFLAIFFAILTICGESYKKFNSWDLVFDSPLRTIGLLIIYSILYYCFIKLIKKNFYKISKNESKKTKIITNFIFEKHSFFIPFIIILLFWLPVIIIKYPGTPGWDFYYFLNSYFDGFLTNHFPLLYVFFCMDFIKYGIVIDNVSLGLFLLTLFHSILILVSISLIFVYLKKWNINYKYRWFLLIFFSINPLFSQYAMTIYHDMIYTTFILIYILELTDVCINKGITSKENIIMLSITSLLICWTRKNGICIVLPTSIILIFKYFLKGNNKVFNISAIIIPIGIYIISVFLFSQYYATNILEAIAIPVQTIARYSKVYHDDISIEEKEKIDGLLNYDIAGQMYIPHIVDPARNNAGNFYSTTQEKIEFFAIWFKLFFRHPDVYIQAVINNTYNLYYPFENATYYFTKVKEDVTHETVINFEEPECLKIWKQKMNDKLYFFDNISIINSIDEPGFYVWIMIVLIVEIIKNRQEILPLIPLIMTFLCCIAGPTIKYNTRYAFPIIFSILPLVAFYSYKINLNKKNN